MIALTSRDQVTPLRFAIFDVVLTRQLYRGFHRFGAARHKIHPIQIAGSMRYQQLGKIFSGIAGEKAGMRESQVRGLLLNGCDDFWITMPKATDRGPARPVEESFPMFVNDIAPLAGYGFKGWFGDLAGKNVAHVGEFPFSVGDIFSER